MTADEEFDVMAAWWGKGYPADNLMDDSEPMTDQEAFDENVAPYLPRDLHRMDDFPQTPEFTNPTLITEWMPGMPFPDGVPIAEPPGVFVEDMHTFTPNVTTIAAMEEARGENPKDRIGITKPQLHLVPSSAIIREAKVMELGARKYGPYNWRENAVKATVYISAAMRHIASYLDGEDEDFESGQSHIAHARACMGILLDAMETGNLVDDRPAPGAAAQLIRELQETK